MPKGVPTKPRASKTKVSWVKRQPDKVKRPGKGFRLQMKKYEPSKHPMVQLLREADPDENVDALLAGFRAGHCTDEKFSGREIAKLRLPDGRVKKMYACDVCGHVGSRITTT
jgi:hypothetical protein